MHSKDEPGPAGHLTAEERAIKERAEAASKGPWIPRYDPETGVLQVLPPDAPDGEFVCVNDYPNCGVTAGDEANLNFIAHARTDIPALLAALSASRAREEALREAVEHHKAMRGREMRTILRLIGERDALKKGDSGSAA